MMKVFIKLYVKIRKNRKIVQIKDGGQPKSNSTNYEKIKVRNKAVLSPFKMSSSNDKSKSAKFPGRIFKGAPLAAKDNSTTSDSEDEEVKNVFHVLSFHHQGAFSLSGLLFSAKF